MKTQTVYVANDGERFDSETACQNHEVLLVRIDEAMLPLGETPKKVKDGKGWVQHNPANVLQAKRNLLKLARPILKGFDEVYKQVINDPDKVHPRSIVGRILDDNDSPLVYPWNRLVCIDEKSREHQQPYYAINGPRPEHVCVEDRS